MLNALSLTKRSAGLGPRLQFLPLLQNSELAELIESLAVSRAEIWTHNKYISVKSHVILAIPVSSRDIKRIYCQTSPNNMSCLKFIAHIPSLHTLRLKF